MGFTKLHDMPEGEIGVYDDNELAVESRTVSDPAAFRGAVNADVLADNDFNLVKFTGNLRRSDGRHEEYGGYRVGLTGNHKGGTLRLEVRDEDGSKKEVAYFDANTAFIPNLQATQSAGKVTRFYTDGGKFCINWQDDTGKVTGIVYDTKGTTDESKWIAVGRVPIEYF